MVFAPYPRTLKTLSAVSGSRKILTAQVSPFSGPMLLSYDDKSTFFAEFLRAINRPTATAFDVVRRLAMIT